jgi:hypothetical protein
MEPWEKVSEEDALGFGCPRCGSDAGTGCRYMADQKKSVWTRRDGYTTHVVHHRGSFTKRCHAARRDAARAHNLWEWQQAGLVPPVPDRQRTIDALMEFDRREHMALRRWLRDYGEILWKDARPDGTFRGEPCLW